MQNLNLYLSTLYLRWFVLGKVLFIFNINQFFINTSCFSIEVSDIFVLKKHENFSSF